MLRFTLGRREFLTASTVLASASLRSAGGARFVAESLPAVLGGTPVRSRPFPTWPVVDTRDEERLLEALRRKEWCRLYGNITATFEQRWAEKLGARFALGVVNGTNALYAALAAVGVEPGDEVIVPPYTFVATVNAVVQHYALPVFTDTDANTFQMDPTTIEDRISNRTRCLLPVHLGGNPADLDRILDVARRRSLPVVEDACQAHAAEWKGRKVGTLGDVGCFSFQTTKILPCGEGGCIVTQREDLYDAFHAFHNNGRDRHLGEQKGYLHQGSNLRLTELQAAVLLAQLDKFDELCRRREANAHRLETALKQIPGVEPAASYAGCTRNTYYIVMLRYDPSAFAGLPRERFLTALQQEGVPAWSGYRPLEKEPFLERVFGSRAYRRLFSENELRQWTERCRCPQNDALCEEGFFLSQEALLGEPSDVDSIVEAIDRIRRYAERIRES